MSAVDALVRVSEVAGVAAAAFDGALAASPSPDGRIVDLHLPDSPVTVTVFVVGPAAAPSLGVQRFTGGAEMDPDATVSFSPSVTAEVIGATVVALLAEVVPS